MSSSFLGLSEVMFASVIPADVLRLAAVQHLSFAASVRASRATTEGKSLRKGESQEDRARYWAGLGTLFQHDDQILGGVSSAVICGVLWALAENGEFSTAQLLKATVVGNEIGGRVGLALAGPRKALDTRASAAAAAAAAATLLGKSPGMVAHAVGNAIQGAPELEYSSLALEERGALPAVAALRALGGQEGEKQLDALPAWCWETEARLTRSLSVKSLSGLPAWRTAIEAVEEVLKRHQKAADKRLRCDQVEKIELRLALPAFQAGQVAGPLSLKQSLGVLLAQHRLDEAVLSADAMAEKAAEIEHVASRVELVHDWRLTMRAAESRFSLFHRAALPMLRPLLKEAPLPVPADWLGILKGRPDRALRQLFQAESLQEVEAYGWTEPVEVKLYTTRGGWWPERRSLPQGVGKEAEAVAQARFGADATALLTPSGPARRYLQELGV